MLALSHMTVNHASFSRPSIREGGWGRSPSVGGVYVQVDTWEEGHSPP